MTFAEFTNEDLRILHANIAELSESGRVGNADSIATRLDQAIQKGRNWTFTPVPVVQVEPPDERNV